jgi:hypothetical protein
VNRHPLIGSNPTGFQPARAKPPTQVPAAAANVSPDRRIHHGREVTWSLSSGSAKILVMDEELVEIRHGADPSDSEEPDRRAGPDPRDEPREVLALGQFRPAPFGEPLEGTGEYEARAGNEIPFPQYDVGGEIMSRPALDQRRSGRAQLVEQIAKLMALLGVQLSVSHGGHGM